MSIEVIYLDMDGVLADFVTPSLKVAGIPLTHDQVTTWNYFEPYMTSNEFWWKIGASQDFWLDIKPYPWASELFKLCKSIAPVRFCSSPAIDPICVANKVQWLRFHGFMDSDKNDYHFTPHKHELAKPGRVLIDDSMPNVLSFREAGGNGIVFPQPWNDCWYRNITHVEYIKHVFASGNVVPPVPEPKEDILDIASRITRGDRQSSYGPPDQDFRRTADMWSALFRDLMKDGVAFEPFHVAQAMILLKMSRQLHQRKRDNWIDTAGYARCGAICDEAAGK